MSGGRATVGRKRGVDLGHQAGDITSVHPEGHALTLNFYIECKHYHDLDLGSFLLARGKLHKFWRQTCVEADRYSRWPMLIAKQDRTPVLILMKPRTAQKLDAVTILGWDGYPSGAALMEFDEFLSYRYDSQKFLVER
jgi:hypothetical protein